MSKALKVGLTGGIGSGKSLVARIFGILGVPCYDSDFKAKWLVENSPDVRQRILQTFGDISYLPSGEYNRQAIAEIVFKDKNALEKLNSIVHPALQADFNHWYNNNSALPFVLKEAALLFETGSYRQLDRIIVVTSPLELRIKHILTRDPHRTKEQIENIIKNQWQEEDKIKLANFTLHNNEKQLLISQVIDLQIKINSIRI